MVGLLKGVWQKVFLLGVVITPPGFPIFGEAFLFLRTK